MTIGRTNRFLLFAARTFAPALAVLTVSAAVPTVSNAATASTDPRTCSYGPARKTDCARDAAKLVARRYLAAQAKTTVSLWQGPMTCTQAGTLLRWRCSFASNLPIGSGWVTVTYRATAKGWTVKSAIVR